MLTNPFIVAGLIAVALFAAWFLWLPKDQKGWKDDNAEKPPTP